MDRIRTLLACTDTKMIKFLHFFIHKRPNSQHQKENTTQSLHTFLNQTFNRRAPGRAGKNRARSFVCQSRFSLTIIVHGSHVLFQTSSGQRKGKRHAGLKNVEKEERRDRTSTVFPVEAEPLRAGGLWVKLYMLLTSSSSSSSLLSLCCFHEWHTEAAHLGQLKWSCLVCSVLTRATRRGGEGGTGISSPSP